jgi:methionyl-tRNA synthetase
LHDEALYAEFVGAGAHRGCVRRATLRPLVREIMHLTDRANLYIDQHKPWLLAKEPAQALAVQGICTQGLNLFRVIAAYLKPVLPIMIAEAERFLGLPPQTWRDVARPQLDATIGPYRPLATRVDASSLKALVDASSENLKPTDSPNGISSEPKSTSTFASSAASPPAVTQTRRASRSMISRASTSGLCGSRRQRPSTARTS